MAGGGSASPRPSCAWASTSWRTSWPARRGRATRPAEVLDATRCPHRVARHRHLAAARSRTSGGRWREWRSRARLRTRARRDGRRCCSRCAPTCTCPAWRWRGGDPTGRSLHLGVGGVGPARRITPAPTARAPARSSPGSGGDGSARRPAASTTSGSTSCCRGCPRRTRAMTCLVRRCVLPTTGDGQPGADPSTTWTPAADDAAGAPGIGRSTLRYLLARIRELSGINLTDADTRFQLHLAPEGARSPRRVWPANSRQPGRPRAGQLLPEEGQGRLRGGLRGVLPDVPTRLPDRGFWTHDHSRTPHQELRPRLTAVDDVTFTAQPGRVTGFLGPNGAGKSTTMRIMVGLTPATVRHRHRRRPPLRRPAQPGPSRSASCSTPRPSTPAAPAARSSPSRRAPWACPAAASTRCSTWSASPTTRPSAGCATTRSACASDSASPPRCSATPRC